MRRQTVLEKEWILNKSIESFIIDEVKLDRGQASRLCSLFKNGCESAYIARYRGDVHGGLPPEEIRKAMEAYFDAVELNKKVGNAVSSVTAKVEGMEEKKIVEERLKKCEDLQEVGEITKEFSTGGRKTKAKIARELGLEPHAQTIFDGGVVYFKDLISSEMKTEKDVREHLKICLADLIHRKEEVTKTALGIAKLDIPCGLRVECKLSRDAAKQKEEESTKKHLAKYADYIGENYRAHKVKDHQISAMNRGVDEGVLSWSANLPKGEGRRLHPFTKRRVHNHMRGFYQEALEYSIDNYFIPKVERATKKYLTNRSMDRSIQLFGENVEQLFAQEGVRGKFVIALDPGSYIKTAFLDPVGTVISMEEFSIYGSSFDGEGHELLKEWSTQTEGKPLVFAVGNGSNSYNTQKAVSSMIENGDFPANIDVSFCVVSECGASKYSCTPAAQEEFGEGTDIRLISAVSIGRRLIDPMSEYVKIEPQHLGKGQYQLSADEKELKKKLGMVVRDRVSLIGADLNQASKHLLQQICGLNDAVAKKIVEYRETNGSFKSREELLKVKGLGEVSFQQCAGFLTVSNPIDSLSGPPAKRQKMTSEWNPLDGTIVHPDDYKTVEELCKKMGITVEDLINGKAPEWDDITEKEGRILELLKSKPQLKPPPPMMKKVREMKDLAEGQRYTSVVRNKTDFGVFADIGVGKDGLVHITEFPNKNEIPSVGELMEVYVSSLRNDRIQLKLAN